MPKNVLVIPSIVGGTTSGGGTGGGAVDSVNGKTGVVVLTKTDLGLGNVDNTSDLNKPISTATQEALDLKADKSTTLSGYGITDAYTKLEVDSKLDTKQNTLSTEQLAAVNSGITAAHITAYDAYAAEISQAQNDATKAENAAEVAQQTANLVGQNLQSVTEKIPTTASATNLLVDTSTLNNSLTDKVDLSALSAVATSGSYNDLTDKPDIPEAYTLPIASTTTLGGVKVDGTTITATAEGVISAPVADTPVATTETAGIVKPSSLTFDVEEDGTLVNKVAGSNCYIYGLKGIGSDDITIAADTTTTIPVGRLRNYNYENGDRLKVGDMLIDLKGNVAKVDRVNTAVLPAGSGPFGVDESSVLVQLQTREDDTLTTSSKEVVGAINELKTATDSKTDKPASYAQADLPAASEHFGEFAIVTDLENTLVWSNGTVWKQITLTDLA